MRPSRRCCFTEDRRRRAVATRRELRELRELSLWPFPPWPVEPSEPLCSRSAGPHENDAGKSSQRLRAVVLDEPARLFLAELTTGSRLSLRRTIVAWMPRHGFDAPRRPKILERGLDTLHPKADRGAAGEVEEDVAARAIRLPVRLEADCQEREHGILSLQIDALHLRGQDPLEAENLMFRHGRSTSFKTESRLAEAWRDLQVVGQAATLAPEWYPIGGRAFLGLEPGPRLR